MSFVLLKYRLFHCFYFVELYELFILDINVFSIVCFLQTFPPFSRLSFYFIVPFDSLLDTLIRGRYVSVFDYDYQFLLIVLSHTVLHAVPLVLHAENFICCIKFLC